MDAAVEANVRAQVATVKMSALLALRITSGEIAVVAAVYDLDTGVVKFLDGGPSAH